jgi:transcriptional regulator with XRE-family HTH domain
MLILTRERLLRGWSKAELARRARINQVTVGQIELGVLRPYASQLRKLAKALKWDSDPTQLVENAEPNEEA